MIQNIGSFCCWYFYLVKIKIYKMRQILWMTCVLFWNYSGLFLFNEACLWEGYNWSRGDDARNWVKRSHLIFHISSQIKKEIPNKTNVSNETPRRLCRRLKQRISIKSNRLLPDIVVLSSLSLSPFLSSFFTVYYRYTQL